MCACVRVWGEGGEGGEGGGEVVRVIQSRPDVQTALVVVVQHLLELIGERRGNGLQKV